MIDQDDFDLWVHGPIAQLFLTSLEKKRKETKVSLHRLSEQYFKPEYGNSFLELQFRLRTLIEIKELLEDGSFILDQENENVS